MAQEAGLDLVEIQPNGDPPVCRIMDFGKFKFEQQKKAHAAKKKTKQVEIKELKFRPVTDVGDYRSSCATCAAFWRKATRSRSPSASAVARWPTMELGDAMVKKIEADIAEEAVIEQYPRMEGRQMVMMIAPKRKQ